MKNRPDTDNYKALFLNDTAMLDVRAPVEFKQGAFPHALNIPLLNDSQREKVGTEYKRAGQDQAIKLGHELITPSLKQQRQEQWVNFCKENPEGYLYCFRGGLRSRITQQWLKESGVDMPFVKGGYKALRRFLIDELQHSIEQIPFIRISGRTGSGKTAALLKMQHGLDFEGIAQHKGSAFGRNVMDTQPSIINWENQISIQLLKHKEHYPNSVLWVEDEGRMIGRCAMPQNLYRKMTDSPRVILQATLDDRIQNIVKDYVVIPWQEYQDVYSEQAQEKYAEFMLGGLAKITKRLGLQRYRLVKSLFLSGLQILFENNKSDGFDEAFRILLTQYYDPMYDYQTAKQTAPVLFSGDAETIMKWSHAQ